MKEPHWLLSETVRGLQERILAEFGGLSGLRDAGLFNSAMARPHQLFSYGKPDLFDLAAAYAFGIARNHPFVDGNKRTAFVASFTFLYINGMIVTSPHAENYRQFVALAAGELDEQALAVWFRANTAPR